MKSIQRLTSGRPFAKKCRVCGDKALAFNFDGLTCESCKAFFRRNAFRQNELECRFENACKMTIKTRKSCPKCRLTRCIDIGMKKEMIIKPRYPQFSIANPEKREIEIIRSELLNPFAPSKPLVSNFVTESSLGSLTIYERAKVDEIAGYYRLFIEENAIQTTTDPPNRESSIEFCEEYSRFIVRAVKDIPTLKSYSINDKMIMVRNFIIIFKDLRVAFYYDTDADNGYFMNVNDQSMRLRMSIDIWDDFLSVDERKAWKNMLIDAKRAMNGDRRLRDILCTLALFKEYQNQGIHNPETMRHHYLEYFYLLTRYLQSKHKNRERFERQMNSIQKLLLSFPEMLEFSRRLYSVISENYSTNLMSEVHNFSELKVCDG